MAQKVKYARCPDCGRMMIGSTVPHGDIDMDSLMDYREAAQKGLVIGYMDQADFNTIGLLSGPGCEKCFTAQEREREQEKQLDLF
jgi:hypothetical protein